MEAEAEKTKRQRSERDADVDGQEKNKKKKVTLKVGAESVSDRNEGSEGTTAIPTPSEEEVEEFFAIVRRMHVAVKYFGRRTHDGASGSRLPPGRWRAALEREDVALDGEVDDCGEEEEEDEEEGGDGKERISKTSVVAEAERVVVVKGNGALDLNSAPEEGCTA